MPLPQTVRKIHLQQERRKSKQSPVTLASRPVGKRKPPSDAASGLNQPARIVPVAKIDAPHGVRGLVSLHLAEATPEVLAANDEWSLRDAKGGSWRKTKVLETKHRGDRMLALLEGISDRNQAQELQGMTVGIERSAFPEPSKGEYYWCDLVGLDVLDESNALLGEVTRLHSVPSNDILEVKGKEGTLLIPFVEPYLVRVDMDKGQIQTRWREDY